MLTKPNRRCALFFLVLLGLALPGRPQEPEQAEGQASAIRISAIDLTSHQDCSRIVIKLTAPAPYRLLYMPGEREATVELTGVTAEGFRPSGDYFDARVSGVWVSEPAAMSATARIVLGEKATNVRAFALSQLPGIVIDVERFSVAPRAVLLPPIEEKSPTEPPPPSEPTPPRPAIATGLPALPGEPPAVAPAIPAPEAKRAAQPPVAELAAQPSPPASAPPSGAGEGAELERPSGDPADFPEATDRFPLRLATPQRPKGREILKAFSEGRYEEVVKSSWDFFESQANAERRTDELEVLALAAEARYQYERGRPKPNYEGPLNYYRQLRRLAPEGLLKAFASYRIAQCLAEMGRNSQARAAFQAVLEAHALPFEEEIGLKMADLALEAQDFENAEESLSDLARRHPDSPLRAEILARLGDALFGLERWEEARAAYREALEADPRLGQTPGPLTMRLARATEALGMQEEAGKLFSELTQAPASGAVSGEDLDRARLHVAVSKAGDGLLLRQGDPDEAQRAMRDLVDLSRQHAGETVGIRASLELALLGLRHRANNAYQEVWDDIPEYHAPTQSLQTLLERVSDPALAVQIGRELVAMARREMRQGDLDEISDALLEALALTAGRAYEGAAECRDEAVGLLSGHLQRCYEANRPFDGVRLLTHAREHIPSKPLPPACVYYGALCYLKLGAAEEALAHLSQLEGLGEESSIPPDAIQFHLAEAEALQAQQAGQSQDAARQRLQKLLETFPDTPLRASVVLLLGRSLSQDGQAEMAAQALQQALPLPGLSPAEQIEGLLALGNSQAQLGQPAPAVQSYMRGLCLFEDQRVSFSESPAASSLLYGLAESLFRVQDWPKAALMFEQHLLFYPDDPLASSARYFLAECQRQMGNLKGARDSYAQLKDDAAAQAPWRDLADQGLREVAIAEASERMGLAAPTAAEGSVQP